MLIQNVSFIINLSHEEELLKWLRPHLGPAMQAGGINPRLSVMRATAGADDVAAHAQTIAFQTEFCDSATLQTWKTTVLLPLIAEFEKTFGPEAVAFTSVFETLPL